MQGLIEEKHQNLPSRIKIGDKYIGGEGDPVFFIADIGANHNGDYFLAKRTIERAAQVGADAVKLQKRFMSEVATRELLEREQNKDQIFGKTYREYREHLELNEEEYAKLNSYANELGLIFYATPFDKVSVDFLENIGVGVYKISSQDITNLPLIEYIAKKGKPMMLSLGAADWEEADEGIETVLKYNQQLIVQYCVSVYPTPDEKLNLTALKLVQERYHPLPVGYSGHERDILPSLAAAALGARTIERHFTLDKNLPGPDHATVSLEPEEFKRMVDDARRLRSVLGQPIKQVHPEEMGFREKHRKSLVTAKPIPAGTVITAEMITCKSPGYGLKPNMMDKIIGKRTKTDIAEDTVIIADFIDFFGI